MSRIEQRTRRTAALLRQIQGALQGEHRQVGQLLAKERQRLSKRLKAAGVPDAQLRRSMAWLDKLEREHVRKRPSTKPVPKPRPAQVKTPPKPPKVARKVVQVRVRGQNRLLVARDAVHRDELATLQRSLLAANKWSYDAMKANRRDIAALGNTQRKMAQVVAQLQKKSDFSLVEGLMQRMGATEEQTNKLLSDQKKIGKAQKMTKASVKNKGKSLQAQLDQFQRATRIQKLNSAATTMQTAAFGVRGDLLASNNLFLAGNELLWGFAGDAAKALGFMGKMDTNPLAWLSPVASLFVGQTAVPDPEPEPPPPPPPPPPSRFVAGVSANFSFVSTTRVTYTQSLEFLVPPSRWEEFSQRTNVPVTAQVFNDDAAQTHTIWASVQEGELTILVIFGTLIDDADAGTTPEEDMAAYLSANNFRVEWIVDLDAPSVDIGPPPA